MKSIEDKLRKIAGSQDFWLQANDYVHKHSKIRLKKWKKAK